MTGKPGLFEILCWGVLTLAAVASVGLNLRLALL